MASEVADRLGIEEPNSLVGGYADYTPTESGFGAPFIDVDEWREKPRRHRYIHGGFEGTHTLFSLYLPPAEFFGGRIVKHLEGGSGGHESLFASGFMFAASWQFDFAFEEFGAILMESNQGHYADEGLGFHNDVYLFGASAESTRFAKWLALKLYGQPVHHAYVFGASGGGHRSYQCAMHRGDVFAGAVPEVCGVSPGIYWSAQALAIGLLGDEGMAKVADACEPGGGDPFEGLTFEQREALADLFRMGYPRPAVNQLQTLAAPFTLYNSRDYNPDYFRDFWTKTGYLGHDHPERLAARRVQLRARIKDVATTQDLLTRNPESTSLAMAGAGLFAATGASLDVADMARIYMADVTFMTGKAKGRKMVVSRLEDGYFLPFVQRCPELFEGVEPGDEVEIDNSDWLALNYLYKHNIEWNVPGLRTPEAPVPAEYLDFAIDGKPIHVQTSEIAYDLNVLKPFDTKMIVIAASLDSMIWPTKLSPLDRHFRQTLGDKVEDTYRFWWVENATHGPPEMGAMVSKEPSPKVWRTRLVDYAGPAKQALLDVAAWAERGIKPPGDTNYAIGRNGALLLPPDAKARGGIQPVVRLLANGAERAEVKVGEPVRFEGFAEAPPEGGLIVRAEIDFLAADAWPYQGAIQGGEAKQVSVDTTYVFDKPGVYFPSFRVSAWREGLKGKGLPVQNLARVRVVVG